MQVIDFFLVCCLTVEGKHQPLRLGLWLLDQALCHSTRTPTSKKDPCTASFPVNVPLRTGSHLTKKQRLEYGRKKKGLDMGK